MFRTENRRECSAFAAISRTKKERRVGCLFSLGGGKGSGFVFCGAREKIANQCRFAKSGNLENDKLRPRMGGRRLKKAALLILQEQKSVQQGKRARRSEPYGLGRSVKMIFAFPERERDSPQGTKKLSPARNTSLSALPFPSTTLTARKESAARSE